MHNYLMIMIISAVATMSGLGQPTFDQYPTYNGQNLGVSYSRKSTTWKVWSPPADEMSLRIYKDGHTSSLIETVQMVKDKYGVWVAEVIGDQANKYYTYQAKINGKDRQEVPDIYAAAVGVNGKRGMVIDMKSTDPRGWKKDRPVDFGKMKDAILYELHIRDATIFTDAKHKGKFLGLTETGLRNKYNQAVGLDHLKALGVTHVHLLPSYDFYTVDESDPSAEQYNWGYDPLNYNVPEGSYATNAYDGRVRVKEFKQMVLSMHKAGINVVMDVVYNHTMHGEHSCFNQLVPDYYYRQAKDGSWSNASGCGNETASDRIMYRKYMIESLTHWVNEYHIDGFRFDLMAIHDISTMNEIATTLRKIKPNIVLYGEGWTAGDSPLPEPDRAVKAHAYRLSDISVFSDDIRDGVKGSVFDAKDTGWATGKKGMEETIKCGLIGAGKHDQVDYSLVNYSKSPYTIKPSQMIAYTECHDNHTLWDRWQNSVPKSSDQEKRQLQKLALSIVLMSQGIPFIHAGQEYCRTKNGDENSYKSGDKINGLNWDRINEYQDVYNWTKDLIALRKTHPAFRIGDANLVEKHVRFPYSHDGVIAQHIQNAPDESWSDIWIIHNASKKAFDVTDIIKTKDINLHLSSSSKTKNKLVDKQCVAVYYKK
jgi:pullulanase